MNTLLEQTTFGERSQLLELRRPAAVDLFCGAGGMGLGFEQAGFDIVAAVEIDPIHCATHEFNFPYCPVICGDIRNVTAETLRSKSRLNEPPVDVVFGGPPCQGFSMIGKRADNDPRNDLIMEFLRLASSLSPKYIVMENVKGLTLGKQQRYLDEIVAGFARVGFRPLLPWRVLNALDFGVPQERERLFLIAANEDLPLPEYPLPLTCRSRIDNPLFEMRCTPSVIEAIGDLPNADDFEELEHSDSVKVEYGDASEYALVLRGVIDDPCDCSYPRSYDPETLTSSLRTNHTPESRRRFAEARHGCAESVSRFLKLDPDGFCNTLRAGTASDRGAFTSPRPIHPVHPRCITVREAARLHSYPDWFRFHTTKWHGARQIGNSVPPLLARAVASSIIRALDIEPGKPTLSLPASDEALLRMNMQDACLYYGIPFDTIPRRTRNSERERKDR